MFVLVARYLTKEGEEENVAKFLSRMAALSNSDIEPGCVLYHINQSTDNPRSFLLYEEYVDEAGFEAHTKTDYFNQLVVQGAVPLLESRERETFRLVAP